MDNATDGSLRSALGEEVLSERFFAFSRQKEIDRRTAGVHRPVQVAPLAPDPDVGFVHAPTVVGRFESSARTSLQFRGRSAGTHRHTVT